MDNFTAIIAISVVVEGLVSYAKMLVVDRKIEWQIVVAVALGVIFAIAYGIDVFALLGMESIIPYFGSVMSGILMSRGANYIFDMFKTIRNHSKQTEPAAQSENAVGK